MTPEYLQALYRWLMIGNPFIIVVCLIVGAALVFSGRPYEGVASFGLALLVWFSWRGVEPPDCD